MSRNSKIEVDTSQHVIDDLTKQLKERERRFIDLQINHDAIFSAAKIKHNEMIQDMKFKHKNELFEVKVSYNNTIEDLNRKVFVLTEQIKDAETRAKAAAFKELEWKCKEADLQKVTAKSRVEALERVLSEYKILLLKINELPKSVTSQSVDVSEVISELKDVYSELFQENLEDNSET